MKKIRLASALFVTSLAWLGAAPVEASLVLALDTTALAQRADHIAVVDVVAVQSGWDGAHRKILTTVDLLVVESWKGGAAPASHFTVVQPGGTVGDTAMVVYGQSQFTPGERTLVFLRGNASAAGVVGMAQGKRPMRRDPASGQWMVNGADRAGLHLVAPAAVPGKPASTPLFTPSHDTAANGVLNPRAAKPASTPASTPASGTLDDSAPRSLDAMRGQIRQILGATPQATPRAVPKASP